MRKGVLIITFLLVCNVTQAQQPIRRSFIFTEKDSTMYYSSTEFYTGKINNKTLHIQQHLTIKSIHPITCLIHFPEKFWFGVWQQH